MNRRPCAFLDYQSLEPKFLLAGNVSVALSGGLLSVTGDSVNNQIQVVGSPDGSVNIVPINDTTINDLSEPFTLVNGIGFANFQMGAGDDSVEISNIQMSEIFTIHGEEGNDRITIDGINAQRLIVNAGIGNDVLEFHNTYSRSDIRIQGNLGDDTVSITSMAADQDLHLFTGPGNDTIAIDDLGTPETVNVSSGSGNDIVAVTGHFYTKKTNFNLGAGDDALNMTPQTSQTSATIRRGLEVKTGPGNDQVLIGAGVESSKRTRLLGSGGGDAINTNGASLSRTRMFGFVDSLVPNLNAALDTFYERLSSANVDTTPFGRVVEVTAPPSLSIANSNLTIAEDDGPVSVDDQLTLSSTDEVNISGATVRIVDNDSALDVLAVNDNGTITGAFNATSGVLTLTGTGTAAEYQTILRAVTYDNLEAPLAATTKRIEFTVTSDAGPTSSSRTLDIEGRTLPTFALSSSSLQLDRSASAVPLDDQVELSGENFEVTGATIEIANFTSGNDILAFPTGGTISGSFDEATGVLTLSGNGSLADYQAALRLITYENTNASFTGTKQVNVSVTSSAGPVTDSREIRILTDAESIQNFADANNLELQQDSSGVQYIVETPGNTVGPTSDDDSVRVKYRGTLLADGFEFDANDNATFPLLGVIPGFRGGLKQFTEGGIGQIFIPADQAYGEDGTTNIPPDSVLRFEVELLEVIEP